LNFHNRSKIACFGAHFAAHNSPIATQESAIGGSHPPFPQFLIATQILEIEPTGSQQTRRHFVISTFSGISWPRLARSGIIEDIESDDVEGYREQEGSRTTACGRLTVCGAGRYNHCFSGGQNARCRIARRLCRALVRRPIPCGGRAVPYDSPARGTSRQRETRARNSRPEFRSSK
jgi:hypothetical protein